MLASEIRKLIAPALRDCPKECGIVTITEVDVTSGLDIITIHLSALQNAPAAIKFMEETSPELRHALTVLHLHRLPELRFMIDGRSEKGSRIEKLLDDAS